MAPSDSRPKPGAPGCGDPIGITTGNMFETMADYATAGKNPLAFTRYYNSMSAPDTLATYMGQNWRNIYDRYLHIINPSAIYGVTAERADGQYVTFTSNSGTYTTDSDLDYKLTVSGSTWTLTAPDDTVETYIASGATAALQSIKLRNGYTQTMNYTSGRLTSVTDSYNRSLGLSYSSVGLLTNVMTPDSMNLTYGYVDYASAHILRSVSWNTTPVTQQQYVYENASFPYALTGIIDENGHRTSTVQYDSSGRATSSQLAGGVNLTTVAYDDSTGNRTVTGPLGIQETYKFTTLQGVPKVTEIDRAANGTVAAATRLFSYDSNGYTKSETDWNGNQTFYTNNANGDPTQIVYASGTPVSHTTNITYDTTWAHLAHIIATPGLTTTNNYETSTGNLLTKVLTDTTTQTVPYSTNGQTRTWTYTYTPTGQIKTVQLPRTDVTARTTFGYGAASPNLGTLVSISDALSHVTTVNTYKPGGLPLTVTDPNSVLTTLGYAPRLWLTSSALTTASGVLTTSLQYDSAGELTKTTLPDASYLSYAYDNAHRPIKITNRLNETQNLTYNSAGNLTQTLWKNAGATSTYRRSGSFDALGRQYKDANGLGLSTYFTFDSQGNVLTVKDPLLHVTADTYDPLNRLKTSQDAATNLTALTYDAHDRPLTVTDPKGNVTTYIYDGFGEPIQETSPDRGTTVWHYDADGNVSSRTDGASNLVNYTYDALDRILTASYPGHTTLNATYTYDQAGHGKGIGRLTSLTDQAGTLSLSYEERGLVTSNARTISSTAYTTGYTYESAGRLSSITYPTAGWKVAYGRDNAGQVSSVTATQPGHSAVNLATSITHYPFGPVKSLTYGNGVTDARVYDLAYRMTSVTDTGTSAIQSLTYGYDSDSNVHTVTDAVTPGNNQTVNYDVLDRLSSATGIYGSTGSVTYDSNSNRLAYGSTAYTYPGTSDRLSTTAGTSVSHTGAGNIASIGTTSLTYSAANRLTVATVSGTSSSYAYDAFGQRLKATTGSGTPQIFNYAPDGSLLTETNSGTETDYAWLDPGSGSGAGSMPLAAIQPVAATISMLHTDRLGTPQKATDASKAIVFNANYDPNGKASIVTSTITQNLRLPGQYADPTGFYHNGFRDYLPSVAMGGGRYAENDPLGLRGGMNGYLYAGANVYRYTDPLGLMAACLPGQLCDDFNQMAEGGSGSAESAAEGGYGVSLGDVFADLFSKPAETPAPAETAPSPGEQCRVNRNPVSDILRPNGELIGELGNGPDVRILPGGEAEAQALFEQLSQGGVRYTGGYRGTGYTLPGGGFVGYRAVSSSGLPTVDVNVGDIAVRFHFVQ